MSRVFRGIVATVTTIILGHVTVNAEPVRISQVIEVIGTYQSTSDLRLRSFPSSSGPVSSNASLNLSRAESSSNLLSGVVIESSDPKVEVIVDSSGDVEGTICDCGEIGIAGGAFPKWPLVFFAALPFFFIHDCDDCDTYVGSTPTPTPTPTTPTTPVPEPASMLLFGSGLIVLAAGLRRKYSRFKVVADREEQ
jgi:PEP-CTERM motif